MANSVTRNLLINEAHHRGWEVSVFGRENFFLQITLPDGRFELFHGSLPSRSSVHGFVIAKHKDFTMDFVKTLGYAVPGYTILQKGETETDFVSRFAPVVVKPSDGDSSNGVTVGIETKQAFDEAVTYARSYSESGRVVTQQQLEGNLYRLTVINGRLVAAAHRKAPEVIGDGSHTVRELIDILNADPRRGKGKDTPLVKVTMQLAEEYLGDKLATIPLSGEVVRVSAIDSISAGGVSINVTESVHEDWHRVVTDIANKAGLFICGYDVMCEDIAKPLRDNFIPMLEMNSMPGFKLHMYPTGGGEPINLAPILLDELFK